jgi:rare lipoprotein A
VLLWTAACGSSGTRTPKIPSKAPSPEELAGWRQRGVASWYGEDFHGRPTASGEIYDMYGRTAAHRTLPFGTRVQVTNLDNGREIELTINDRGPFIRGRILDVTYTAARELGMIGPGTARVELRVLGGAVRASRGELGKLETVEEALADRLFTVQVGAFEDPRRAHRLRARLGDRFPDAVVRSEGVWHRVQVGTFATREAAEETLGKLLRQGYPALVVALP